MPEIRLIDANTLLKSEIDRCGCVPIVCTTDNIGYATDCKSLRYIIEQQETIEAEPVRYGHWVLIEHEFFTCSECGNAYFTGADSTSEAMHKLKTGDYFAYCPHCGAKMKLENLNGENGTNGKDGTDGKSAYELAVQEGFDGTLEEWFESLKGVDGLPGKE